jgi:uncharacterized membrane protein
MGLFLTGLLIFLGIHSISIINESWRDRMVNKIGEWPWKGVYSLAAIFGFILMIWGYGAVRYDTVVLYTPPEWQQYISLLLLLPVFPLLIAAYFPGRIKAAATHPMLLATILWAIAHLFINGSLNNVILFGSFLAWAVWDLVSVQHRQPRPIPGAPHSKFNDIIACVLGLGLYFAFVFRLHELLIGISPT